MSKSIAEKKPLGFDDVVKWQLEYLKAVRNLDYDAGRNLFHQNAIAVNSHSGIRVDSLDDLAKSWEMRWPNDTRLEFINTSTKVIPSPCMMQFVVVTDWVVPSTIIGGRSKSGRATFVLCDFENKLLCVHVHSSVCA